MLKWTTYDGTEATLPQGGNQVVLQWNHKSWDEDALQTALGGADYIRAIFLQEDRFGVGMRFVRWLPIPTPADLAKWEALLKRIGRAG